MVCIALGAVIYRPNELLNAELDDAPKVALPGLSGGVHVFVLRILLAMCEKLQKIG